MYNEAHKILRRKENEKENCSITFSRDGCAPWRLAGRKMRRLMTKLTIRNTLVVAMELAYPPFETKDADGNPSGVSVDFAKAFGEYIGKDVVIENIAWDGLIPALQTGKADMVMSSMTITDERKEKVDFSEPYANALLALLTNKDSGHHLYRGYECRGTKNRRQNRLDRLFLCAEKSA